MKSCILPLGLSIAALVFGRTALADREGINPTNDNLDDIVVLGEEDWAERSEILRNQYRRMTPGNEALVQDVGAWPAAWETFGAGWDRAAAERNLATWVVPVSSEREGGATVLRDGNGVELWRGTTDFAKETSTNVVLTGAFVDESDWPLYTAVQEELAWRRAAEAGRQESGELRGDTNGPCQTGLHFVSAVGNFTTSPPELHVGLVWTNNATVDVFAYGPLHVAVTNEVTWTNDENVVETTNVVSWHAAEPTLTGFGNTWKWVGSLAVSNTGTNVFIDDSFPATRGIVRYYAAAEAVDSDGDGLNDGFETFVSHSDPGLGDSDGDGIGDGVEVALGADPADAGNRPRVLLNAVLYNPAGTDTGKEWIEVYSASTRAVDLGGVRLQVGKETGWETVATFPVGTSLSPGRILLLGESLVTNADITALLDIPNAWTNEPTTGLRLVCGGTTNEMVLDTVFIGGGTDFNESGLDETGWLGTNSVWAHAGTILERRFPGVDTDHTRDWHEMPAHQPRNSSAIPDFDGDGLSDGDEWTGDANPWGEPTNPWNADSDGDGLGDYEECITYGTNPNTWATDGDIWPWTPEGTVVSNWPGSDSYELLNGWNPLASDENTNGIPDSWEMAMGLANLDGVTDSDGDGFDNLSELRNNSNPLDGVDSSARDFIVFYEATVPGWVNKAMDNDIGLGGMVNVRFLGLRAPQRICILVGEGNVPEPFSLKWFGACDAVGEGHGFLGFGATSAWADDRAWLQVTDAGLYPEFEETLGGEYTIDFLVWDLMIRNGGRDLDTGQEAGPSGDVVAEADEEIIGAYVLVNWDDDDGDGIMTDEGTWSHPPEPDLGENWVDNEDNLAQLQPNLLPLPQKGIAELEVSGIDSDKIKFWTQSCKGTEIPLDSCKKTWDLSAPSERGELENIMENGCWLEGTAPGTSERGVTLTFRYKNSAGATLCEDCCRATVVMIRLGNVAYRELLSSPLRERCHAGIVFSFAGQVDRSSLTNSKNYGIMQMPGLNHTIETLNGLTSDSDAEYWYCYTATAEMPDNIEGYRKRLKILRIAVWAENQWQKNYCAFKCIDPKGLNWNGKLTDIDELRCDGLVELAYEINGVMVWGKRVGENVHYDIRDNAYLDEHNEWQWGDDPEDWDDDMYGTCLPITQGGFADAYIAEHRPSYQGSVFRGVLWETMFHEQRLIAPEVLSPEKHHH